MFTAAGLLYGKAAQWQTDGKAIRILALNALPDPAICEVSRKADTLIVQQSFRPDWLQLQHLGLSPQATVEDIGNELPFDLALVLPGRQREEGLGMLAIAMKYLRPGGSLLAACANTMGGKGYEKRLSELAGEVSASPKSHCRLFRTQKSTKFNIKLADHWIHEAMPRLVATHGLIARPGNFSWEKPDKGSELLRRYLENRPIGGRSMDLCCGYGYLANRILACHSGISELYLVDADRYALDCAMTNTREVHVSTHAYWLDAMTESLPKGMDCIVLNPPFHRGNDVDIKLGQTIAAQACRSLKPGGRLTMVANRQLPYERVCKDLLTTCDVADQNEGFKILEGSR